MAKKQLVFRVPYNIEPYVIAEEIKKVAQSQYVSLEIYPSKIVARLYGDPVSIKRSEQQMKNAYKNLLKRFQLTSGRKVIIPKNKVANFLGFPLSLDLLKDTLRLLGIPFEEDDEKISVGITYQELIDYAKKLFDNYVAAKELFAGSAKKVACVISFVFDVDLDDISKIGENLGVFKKINEKYYLAINPDEAYRRLTESFVNQE